MAASLSLTAAGIILLYLLSCLQGLSRYDDDAGTGADYIVVEMARQPLQARRTRRQDLDGPRVAVRPQPGRALLHLPLLAEADLGRDVGADNGERARFPAAPLVLLDPVTAPAAQQRVDHVERLASLHR